MRARLGRRQSLHQLVGVNACVLTGRGRFAVFEAIATGIVAVVVAAEPGVVVVGDRPVVVSHLAGGLFDVLDEIVLGRLVDKAVKAYQWESRWWLRKNGVDSLRTALRACRMRRSRARRTCSMAVQYEGRTDQTKTSLPDTLTVSDYYGSETGCNVSQ